MVGFTTLYKPIHWLHPSNFQPLMYPYTGAVVAILLGLIIFGGINRVAKASEIIVPIMAVLYIATALIRGHFNITHSHM